MKCLLKRNSKDHTIHMTCQKDVNSICKDMVGQWEKIRMKNLIVVRSLCSVLKFAKAILPTLLVTMYIHTFIIGHYNPSARSATARFCATHKHSWNVEYKWVKTIDYSDSFVLTTTLTYKYRFQWVCVQWETLYHIHIYRHLKQK